MHLEILVLHRFYRTIPVFSRLLILPWNVSFGKLSEVIADIILENLPHLHIGYNFYDTDIHSRNKSHKAHRNQQNSGEQQND